MPDLDVVVVGAGFGGIYAVHKLRDGLGLSVGGFEAGDSVGGTWLWNRYPGARCDLDSIHYQYSFSPELQSFAWKEKFASQPEILEYLEWVADRLDVRRTFEFGTRVVGVRWDEDDAHWVVTTDKGGVTTARYVVSCVGNLSAAKDPEFPGVESFAGRVLRTSSWPAEPIDFTGLKVGVVGTGASGIQVIPELAERAGRVTVFQRTPNFAVPVRNRALSDAEISDRTSNVDDLRSGSRDGLIGIPYPAPAGAALAATSAEREEVYRECWDRGGMHLLTSSFNDILFSEEANETLTDFLGDRIREQVEDPDVAELLVPTGYPYGAKRPPLETDYYAAFNRENVRLVDIADTGITEVTDRGVLVGDELHDVDVLVLATGFDAITRPILDLNIEGRRSVPLSSVWSAGPTSYLGIATSGFPNLFTVTGPQSPIGLYNFPLFIEDHVDFVASMIDKMRTEGLSLVEADPGAEVAWNRLVGGLLSRTVIPKGVSTGSWYTGSNVAGKATVNYIFAGGVPLYRAICGDVASHDFGGFSFDGRPSELPPLVKLDSDVALVLGSMLLQGAKPLETLELAETRALMESLPALQGSAPPTECVVVDEPRLRIYRPAAAQGSSAMQRPVILFLHPGGWSAGSLDVADGPCRTIADRCDAVVVSAAYRLAPEHPFPAGPDDAFAALAWVLENIEGHGGDPRRVAVAGESAGGNLAALTALRARDAGLGVAAQILLYPPIDPEAVTASRREFELGPFLTGAALDLMWQAYLDGAPVELAAPNRATELAGLPPTLVVTLACDATRDEAEDYGAALADAGVDVEVRRIDGMMHGALNLGGYVPAVSQIFDAVTEFVGNRL